MGKSPSEAKLKPKGEASQKTILYVTAYIKSSGNIGYKKKFVRIEKNEL